MAVTRIANPDYLWFDITNVEQHGSSEFVIPWHRSGDLESPDGYVSRITNPVYLWFDIANIEQHGSA
ncbi:hypothetical protein, partial [Cyclobacterium roseum]|uniref:hypothetical protein n=1 Tax=Cyclobacterium roseum TaxID=2666137 RepID=UPI001F2F0EBB